jgi:nucleoside-triphosphatase THEP1
VLKGTLITFWICLYTKNFTSSNAYKRIKRFLPNELGRLVNLSSGAIAVIQKTSFCEIGRIKKEKNSYWGYIVNFFYTFAKLVETIDVFALNKKFYVVFFKKVIILTGRIHEGKTTFAANIVREAVEVGLKVGGILPKAEISNGERTGYNVLDIKTQQTLKLITKEPTDDYYDHFGSCFFLKNGMKLALECLSPEYLQESDIVIVDEIGAMELKNRGYGEQVTSILNSDIPVVVLIIREQFIKDISLKYDFSPHHVVKVGDSPESVIKLIEPLIFDLESMVLPEKVIC